MQDVLYVEDIEQAAVLLKPARLEILQRMAEETTCTRLAEALDSTPQRVHYHVKALEEAGLVERVAERRVKGIVEGIYRARARSYWMAPRLVRQLGGETKTRDQTALGYLFSLAEEIQEEVGRLSTLDTDVPSLALSAHVELKDGATRAAFMADVRESFEAIARKYGATSEDEHASDGFRVALACYPTEEA